MAKTKKGAYVHTPSMKIVVSFIIMLLSNILVVYFAHLLFPKNVALGTIHIPKFFAIFHSIGTLTLFNTFAVPFIRLYERKQDHSLSPNQWLALYLVINFIILWLLARFSDQFGLGLSSWFVALILAAALDVTQNVTMMKLEKYCLSKS